MSKYATLADCQDPSVIVTDDHLNDADVFVDLALNTAGITYAEIQALTLPNLTLKTIAVYWAKHLACNEGIMTDSTALISKGDRYKADAEALSKRLNKTVLGIVQTTVSSGYGSVTIGRG